MNFSYMIILLFAIMLFIIFKTKPKSYMVLIYITILLILNEIYNYRDYNKDNFQGTVTQSLQDMLEGTNYDYGQGEKGYCEWITGRWQGGRWTGGGVSGECFKKGSNTDEKKKVKTACSKYYTLSKCANSGEDLNPQHYLDLVSLNELQQYTIPFEYDKQLEGSMSCVGKEQILDMINQQDKLKSQSLYMNKLYNFFDKKNIDFDKLETLKGEVFDPIKRQESLENLKCPTSCHLISDEEVCRKALHVPVFETAKNYTGYLDEIEKCTKLNHTDCKDNESCYWDDDFKQCYYDKRRCYYKKNFNNKNPQCYTRCEYLTIPTEELDGADIIARKKAKSKSLCENAKSYNTTNYNDEESDCKWDPTSTKCVTTNGQCSKYETERECDSDSNCVVNGNKCIEQNLV